MARVVGRLLVHPMLALPVTGFPVAPVIRDVLVLDVVQGMPAPDIPDMVARVVFQAAKDIMEVMDIMADIGIIAGTTEDTIGTTAAMAGILTGGGAH